jgi:hypothetical protein
MFGFITCVLHLVLLVLLKTEAGGVGEVEWMDTTSVDNILYRKFYKKSEWKTKV